MPAALEPRVSVVVATHNRPDGVRRLLGALTRQSLARDRFEVILVDDGSPVPVETEDGEMESAGLSVRVLRHEISRGPAAARNTGWRAAASPLVAFTDDDCRPEPGWLEELLSNAGRGTILQGRTVADSDPDARSSLFSRSQTVDGPNLLFETCNIAYPRDLLERVGGFDETFRNPCGEDVDLGWRAQKEGARLRFVADAVVRHAVTEPTLPQSLRRTLIWHDAVRVVKLHPELRRMLVGGLLWKPSHLPLLILALGATAAVTTQRRMLLAVAAVPYLLFYERRYSNRSRRAMLKALPRHLAIDATELSVMVAGSIRHRTLML